MSTTQLSPTPVFKGWDNNGNPLAFGKLYSYIAGTTTPTPTYTDSTGNTPNTNPVILNARGEAPVWLNPTQGYKLNLIDSSGNQIPGWPVDNIIGPLNINQSLIPAADNTYDLGSTSSAWRQLYLGANHAPVLDTSSGIIGYYPRTAAEIAAGVTPANYAWPADPYVDPRRYGADPTGVSLSTTAVQNAINVAYQAKSMVWIGAGCNFLVGALTISPTGNRTNDGLIIQGSAPNGSRLTQSGSLSAIITVTGATPTGNPQQFMLRIRDLAIHGVGKTADGIALVGVAAAKLENLYIGSCNRAVYGYSCLESLIYGCWLADSNYGAYFRTDGTGSAANLLWLDHCLIDYNSTYGIDYDQGDELQVEGCDIEQNGTALNSATGGIHIGSSVNASPTYGFGKVSLLNNWLEANTGGYSIQVDAPTEGQNVWITIRGGHTASSANGTAIKVAGTGGAGHLVIAEHYSGSPGDTWDLTSAYATLQDVNVNVLIDTGITYPTYHGVNTGTLNERNGRVSSVVLTLTGCTTAPTVTADVYEQGDEVSLFIPVPGVAGVSNSTAATLTGLPATLYPANDTMGTINTQNNSAAIIWPYLVAAASGVITLGNGEVFAASGNKGVIGGWLRWRVA